MPSKSKSSARIFDPADAAARVNEIAALRMANYDLVERAGKLQLPLILGREEFNYVFNCALAELIVVYSDHPEELEVLMESYFDRKTIRTHFFTSGRLNLLNPRALYTQLAKRRIIGIAYPWYNEWMYLALARITRSHNIKVQAYRRLVGNYRYFRYYPISSSTFRIMDGYMVMGVDESRNIIAFGDRSRAYRDRDIFEHRGFVLPSDTGNLSLMGFRESVVRLGLVRHSRGGISHGILTSATRRLGRPFSSRFLMVQQGLSELYDIEIPSLNRTAFFDQSSDQYRYVEAKLSDALQNSVFANEGLMWGDPSVET